TFQWRFNGLVLSGATNSTLSIPNAQAANAGNYQVVVANSIGSVTSLVGTLSIVTLPVINQQPLSLTVTHRNTATFSLTASGTAQLILQWPLNGANLAGATNSPFTFLNAQPPQAGNYQVVVANNTGSVTSAVATLTVLVGPTITQQPVSTSVAAGATASFTVV